MEIELRNCIKCGKFYRDIIGRPICVDCSEEEEGLFGEVKDYLRNATHRISVQELSEATNVSTYTIQRWIREERLWFSKDGEGSYYKCAKCGVSIVSGRYCVKCKANVLNKIKEAGKLNNSSGIKMHYLDNK